MCSKVSQHCLQFRGEMLFIHGNASFYVSWRSSCGCCTTDMNVGRCRYTNGEELLLTYRFSGRHDGVRNLALIQYVFGVCVGWH